MSNGGNISRNLADRWVREAPVYLVSAALLWWCIAILTSRGVEFEAAPILANANLFALSAAIMLAGWAGRELVLAKPRSPLAHLSEQAKRQTPALAGALPMLALLVVLMPFFSKAKAAIPLFGPYDWDASFIAWDRALFFGHDAWEVLQPLLGYPAVTALLALLYQAWFLLLFVGTLCLAFLPAAAKIRRQFFMTYVLAWTIVGGLMATWLASVGPCFLEPLQGNATFAPQMAYLESANAEFPVMTLQVQQMLLDWHAADADGLGSGITAMPSMHVAIAFLFYLATRRISQPAGRWFAAFFGVTWLSSVHLAYHYAVDGLVSVIAVAALWKVSGALLAGWDRLLDGSSAQPTLRTKTVPAE